MPFEKLTQKEVDSLASRGSAGYQPYTEFIADLRVGQGGRITVAEEGVARNSVKQRLTMSAAAAGVTIKFLRSSEETVVFQVTGRSS